MIVIDSSYTPPPKKAANLSCQVLFDPRSTPSDVKFHEIFWCEIFLEIMTIKNFMKYFKEGVMKYFKISMKFFNISK